MSDDVFRILVVCTGNICRSPVAHSLLAQRLASRGVDVEVSSAGTAALVGRDMTPESRDLLRHHGASPDGAHQARQLTSDLVENADLVLTATRDHRHDVIAATPRASRYSFTIRQFARLVEQVDFDAAQPRSPGDLVAEVGAIRGMVPPPARPDDDDIRDPYRRDLAVYAEVGDMLDASASSIVAGFVAASDSPKRRA